MRILLVILGITILGCLAVIGVGCLLSEPNEVGVECITAGNCPDMNGDGVVDLVDFSIIAAKHK